MRKNNSLIKKYFILLMLLLLTSCGQTTSKSITALLTTTTQQTTTTTTFTGDPLERLSFNDKKVEYNGEKHALLLEGPMPGSYSVEYTNNEGIETGRYHAKATVKDGNGEVLKTFGATLFIDNPKNEEFETYLDSFFVKYLEEDQLSVNIFTENPKNFGLEPHYDAAWYKYEQFDNYEEAQNSDKKEFENLLSELEVFKDERISEMQMVSYKAIESFLKYNIDILEIPYVFFMENHYVDQFGGYVADFSTYMETYNLREEADILDLISFIESTEEAFPSYALYVGDKVKYGYPLTDTTLNLMKDYLNNVLEDRDNYYLKDVLAARINAVNFIGKDKKDEYISKINKAIDENYINGVERLNNALDEYFGKATSNNSSYLASYEKGKELYLLKLSNLLGIENLNVEEYIAEIDEMLTYSVNKIISTQNSMIKKYKITSYAQLENLLQGQIIFEGTPEEMMGYLKEFAKTIVPELKEEPEITIKNMDDASAEASNAVAYYMKSALDNTDPEEITLNQLKLGDANNTLSTLGHEGYPGHLYAYCYSKEIDIHNIAKIMTSTAHGEGWATYTQLKLYEYAKKSSKDSKFKDVMNYLYYNDLSSFLLETRIDVGIHYEGWSVSKVAKFLGDLGYNSDAAQEIYDLIIEMPSQYAAYGYGKLVIYNLHEDAKNILGDHYNEIEFNSMILSKGWSSMDTLRNTYNDYMAQEINRYNIELTE